MDTDKTIIGKLETIKHIHKVRENLFKVISLLDERARNHDLTKLESPEAEIFGEHTPELAKTEYGSEEYKKLLEKVKPALDNHYKKNRHHVEFHESNEEWKDVIGYEGYYMVSNMGNVKSTDREVPREKMGNIKKVGKLLNVNITPKGYCRVQLAKDKIQTNHLVHRLVAESFLSNEKDKPFVNHKNSNRRDNNVSNLEWNTASENLQHAYEDGLKISNAKYVIRCIDLDLVTIGVVKMQRELFKLGYEKASSSAIYNCLDDDCKHLDLSFESFPLEEIRNKSYIEYMDLVDLLEMLCDWHAATERNKNGNIRKSIEHNTTRYGMSEQLAKIFQNTIDRYF
jgi:hypothetical protein